MYNGKLHYGGLLLVDSIVWNENGSFGLFNGDLFIRIDIYELAQNNMLFLSRFIIGHFICWHNHFYVFVVNEVSW